MRSDFPGIHPAPTWLHEQLCPAAKTGYRTTSINLHLPGQVTQVVAEVGYLHNRARICNNDKRTNCRHLESPSTMTTATIINRILANKKAYEDRNAKKVASEQKYYKAKQHVREG